MDPWTIISWTLIAIVCLWFLARPIGRFLWFLAWFCNRNRRPPPRAGQLWESIDTEYEVEGISEYGNVLIRPSGAARIGSSVKLSDWPRFVRRERLIYKGDLHAAH